MKMKQRLLVLLLSLAPVGLFAQHGPHWWHEYDVVTGAPADDYSAVNQGQLKYFAYKAYEYLLDEIPSGSGPEWDALAAMIDPWETPGQEVDDFHAVNIGQLKYVASRFYDVLIHEGFSMKYPWDRPVKPADDYAMANIGQMKNMFSFDIVYPKLVTLSSTPPTVQVYVSRGIASKYFEWIKQFDLPLSQQGFHSDPANDGIPNLLKFAMDLNPTIASNASMPEPTTFEYDEVEYFGIVFDRPKGVIGVSYHIDVSTNFFDWTEVFSPLVVISSDEEKEEGLATDHERVWMSENVPKSELPSIYGLRLRILLDDPGCDVLYIFGFLNWNMILEEITFLGQPEQRACFSDGGAFGLDFSTGMHFSTGNAERWTATGQSLSRAVEFDATDLDLDHWMTNQGFFDQHLFNFHDVSGVEVRFTADLTGESSDMGVLEVPFIFASDEYYSPAATSENDGMVIFLFELDEDGNIIQGTRSNIGILTETETHSRAVNVFNAGEVLPDPGPMQNNWGQSGFNKNSDKEDDYPVPPEEIPPFGLGYSGFTSEIVASGGVSAIYEDVAVRTLFRQANTTGMEPESPHGDRGWGGVVVRGSHVPDTSHVPDSFGSEFDFSGYAVGFGLDGNEVVFIIYKVVNHFTDKPPGQLVQAIYPNVSSSSIEVLDSESVPQFSENQWYWIEVDVQSGSEGNLIRAKFWEKGADEPNGWTLDDVIDSNDPLPAGFVGLIHMDTTQSGNEASDIQWDIFEIDAEPEYMTEFDELDPGMGIPDGWSSFGRFAREWEAVDDASATGGRYLRHTQSSESERAVAILKPKGPNRLESGKEYLLRIVVADGEDQFHDSGIFLKAGGIRVVPD